MLDAWYFAACVQVPQTQMSAFLGAIDALTATDSDERQLEVALGQLSKAEPIMRHYAIPHLIALGVRDDDAALGIRAAVRRALASALGELEDAASQPLLRAWEAIIRSGADEVVLANLRAVCEVTGSRWVPPVAEAVPYFAVDGFVAEVTALAMLAHAVPLRPSLARGVVVDETLSRLLTLGLKGRFGRLGFLVAVQTATLLGDHVSAVTLIDAPRAFLTPGSPWELDVLAAFARTQFGYPSRTAGSRAPADAVAAIALEAATFRVWDTAFKADPRPGPADQAAVSRLGLVGRPDLAMAMSLWQAVLWELACEFDGAAASSAIADAWRPPDVGFQAPVRVWLPMAPARLEAWRRRAAALAGLRRNTPEIVLKPKPSSEARLSPTFHVAVTSPWMTFEGDVVPREADGLALLRLLTSGVTAIRLIRRVDADDQAKHVAFLFHLEQILTRKIHRTSVADTATGRITAEPSMAAPLLGLAATVHRSLRQVGSGRYERVDPARFVEFLTAPDVTSRSTTSLRTRTGQHALARWVRDALSGSIPGDGVGQGRWRSGAPGETPAETALRAGASAPNVTAALLPLSLLVSYFDPDFPRSPEIAWFNWRKRDFYVSVQAALAAPRLDLEGWRNRDISALVGRGGPSPRVALETLRLEALMRAGMAAHPDLAGWVDDWHRLLDTLDSPNLLPRELRVVMLRLLDRAIEGTDREYAVLEQLLDVEVELGWGTPYDRWMMFSLLGPATKLPPETARRLRQRLLIALYHDERDRTAGGIFADPWWVLDQRENQELQARLMQRFIVETGRLESDLHDGGIAAHLESLWLSAHRGSSLRELELGRVGARLDHNDRRLLVGAVSDARVDDLRVHLLPASAPADGSEIVDAFTASSSASAERARAGARLVGLVAARQNGRLWVNAWLDDLIEVTSADGVRVGDLIELRAHGSPLGIVAELGRGIEIVPSAPMPGAVRDAVLTVAYGPDLTRIGLAVEGMPPIDLDAVDEDSRVRWMPDMVGLLTGTVPETSPVLAIWSGAGWVPIEFGVPELLASLGDDTVRLVVVEARKGRMLVAPGPGRLVSLSDRSWDPEDLRRVRATTPESERMRGLVLAVRGDVDDDGAPRLRLAAGDSAIDARAVRWATVFDDDGDYEARPDEAGRPMWDSGIDGMPLVGVEGLAGTAGAFRPGSWKERDQRRATVRAEPVATSSLRIGGRGLDDLRSLLNVEPGSRFMLQGVRGGERNGTRAALLTNELRVEVETESLSFGVQGPRKEQINRRHVEVTFVTTNDGNGVRTAYSPGIGDDDLLDGTDRAWREDVRMDLGRHRSFRGIVVEAPSAPSAGSAYEVWFDLGHAVSVVHIRRDAFEVAPRGVGDIVTGTSSRGRWALVARQRRIRVRGLWTVVSSPPRRGGIVLGTVPWEGALRNVVQDPAKPVLYLLPGPARPHLTFIDARGRDHADADLAAGRLERTRVRQRSGGRVLWRVVLRVEARGHEVDLAGDVVNDPPDPDAVLEGVDILLESVGEGHYGVRRLFTVSSSVRETERFQPVDPFDGLAAYLDNPIPIDAELVGSSTVRLHTSWSVPADGSLTKEVPLGTEEEPWVDVPGGYPRKGIRVLLTMESGRVVASYRRVPVLSLDAAVEEFRRQGVLLGERHPLRQRLRYVDRQETAEGVQHRFEWGYGWMCSIPESRITIGGQAAPKWPILPFHGDEITHLLVRRDRAGLRIDIDVDAIDQGFLSELYSDAQQGVVPTATIELEAGTRPRITALHVRDRRARNVDSERVYDDRRHVAVRRVRLTDKAVAAIAATGFESGTRLAFVRLMTSLFDASGGRVVEFDFVSPRLGGAGALRPQDRVFLTVTRPFKTRNDVGLELAATDVIGADEPLKVVVLRRNFSWRQDLLRRLVTDATGALVRGALVGDVYLVRIEEPRQNRPGSVSGTVAGGLARPVRMLHSHVNRSSDACFAVVDATSDRLGLEIRPNVVFRLEPSDFDADEPINDRSIVRVLSRGGRLFLVTALGGDASYVPRSGRPVILLPMQTLLRPGDKFDAALRNGAYSIAGLPQLRPSASRDVDPAFARALLTTPHPKIALLRNQDGRLRIEPLESGDLRAATFAFETDGTVSATLADGTAMRIEWDQISFRDAGAAVLRKLAPRAAWVYHDETTSHRSADGDQAPAPATRLEPLPRHESDPVFFTRGLGLRYAGPELERIGFPAREMLAGPMLHADEPPFAVAGLLRRSGAVAGLWLESSPGHIVEITSSMFAATGADSIAAVDWGHFAVGDLVKLSSHRSNGTELATLRLDGWSPGPRAAYGRRALLPVRSVDSEAEAMTLGAGVWVLERPLEPDVAAPSAGRMVWLTRDRTRFASVDVGVSDLEVGDAVLVGLVDGRPAIRGLDHANVELAAEPGSPDEWIVELLRRGDASLLDLLGGSLPFTVRAVEADRVVLDRGRQQGVLRPGSTVPCQPLGLVNGWVIARAGARIYRCEPDAVIAGLPIDLLSEAVEALARRRGLTWLVNDARTGPRIGARAAAAAEIRAQPIAVLSSDEVCGVLCWDTAHGSAVWLPSERMGWMSPDPAQVRAWVSSVLARSPGNVLVAVLRNGAVSVSDTIAARHRLKQLRAGGQVQIEVIGDLFVVDEPDRVRYLARLHLTDVLLEYVARADQRSPGQGPRFGEIESIDAGSGGPPSVRVADLQAREFRAALPAWFVRSGKHPLAVPARFEVYRGAVGVEDGDPLDVALVRAASSALDGLPLASGLLDQWLGRHGEILFGLRDAELDLPPALASVVLLAAASDLGAPAAYAQASVHALRQIGLRSAMSRHLTPLLELWLPEPADRPGLWHRLQAIGIAPRMSREEVERISRLSSAIRSRTAAAPDEQLALYGESLAASIGAHSRFDTIADRVDLLRDLSDLGRALTPRHDRLTSQGALISAQVSHVRDAFLRSLVEAPITLLSLPASLQDPAVGEAALLFSALEQAGDHRS